MRNCVKYVRSSRSHIGNCDYYQWQSRCQSTWTICYTSLSYVGLSTSQLRAAIFRRDGASLRVALIYYVAALRCVSVRIFLVRSKLYLSLVFKASLRMIMRHELCHACQFEAAALSGASRVSEHDSLTVYYVSWSCMNYTAG